MVVRLALSFFLCFSMVMGQFSTLPQATGLPVSLVRDNDNQLTLAADCAVTACNFGFGAAVVPISQSAVVTLSANAGTARIYITPAGALTVGYSAAAGITCDAGCTAAPNVTAFPSDSIPLYEITYDFAVGGFAATPTNRRSMLSTKVLVQGAGTMLTENGDGSTTIAVDTAAVTVATTSPQAVVKTGFFLNNSAGAMTFNLPVITASTVGNQYCFRNYTARSGAITLQLPAATSVDVDGENGTAAGTLVSGGALGDAACVVAVAVGQYMAYIGTGVWTNN